MTVHLSAYDKWELQKVYAEAMGHNFEAMTEIVCQGTDVEVPDMHKPDLITVEPRTTH